MSQPIKEVVVIVVVVVIVIVVVEKHIPLKFDHNLSSYIASNDLVSMKCSG